MDRSPCTNIRHRVRATLMSANPLSIDPALVTHIAGCPLCRGALLLLIAEIFGLFPVPTSITCDTCDDDLAAFIDREREAGAAAAARDYPQVWWHLWTCEECVATYEFTYAALDLPPLPAFAELAARTPLLQRRRVLHLRRHFLAIALPVHSTLLGVARGASDEPVMISEKETDRGHSIRLSVEERSGHDWCVIVEISPVAAGWLILQLGSQTFRARFDEHGFASATIPAALLTAADGPDLTVDIEEEM